MNKDGQEENSTGSEPNVPYWPEALDKGQLAKELSAASDRAAALTSAAFLEWRVKQAIKSRVLTCDDKIDIIIGTDDSPGKLGFVDNCRLAYSLGLIGPVGFKDLESIARIRNKFAHHMEVDSFNHNLVKGKCDALRTPQLVYEMMKLPDLEPSLGNARWKYLSSCSTLSTILWTASIHFKCELKEVPDTAAPMFW